MRDSIPEKEMVFLRMTPKVVHWPSHIYIMYTTVSSKYGSHFARLMQDIQPQIQKSVPHPMIEKNDPPL